MTAAVAALFVDTSDRGPYPKLLGPDRCWGVDRDARTYAGPGPVVAHPPCDKWGPLANVNWHRYGGEHNRPGNDGGCFESALRSLFAFGGVLEHPARSMAWKRFGLSHPSGHGWMQLSPRVWTCEVWQSAYGHPCHKATWLLYAGAEAPFELDWRRDKSLATHQIGGGVNTGHRNRPRLPGQLAHLSPPAFAEELIRLAAWSRGPL